MSQEFIGEVVRLGGPVPTERHAFLFLRANQGHAAHAARQFISAMRFRAEVNADKLKINDVEHSLRGRLVDILAHTNIPGHPPARDRAGRPLMHYVGRNIHPGMIQPLDVLKQVIYKMELMEQVTGNGSTEEICSIVDMRGWTMANFSPEIEKVAMDTMNLRYPGHIGPSIIINAPWFFRIAWNICKPFVPREMQERIIMCNVSRLPEFIDPSNLLPEYGGTLEYDFDAWIANRYVVEGIPYGTPSTHTISPAIYSEIQTLGLSAADLSVVAIKSGTLEKRGAGAGFFGTTSWKKRFFVITGTQLIYFDSGKGNKPHRCWDIRAAEVEDDIPDHDMGFAISFSSGRRLLLAASTEQERREWIELFRSIASRPT